MPPADQYALSAVDISGSEFTVEQTGQDENFRPEYEARDVTGETLFSGRYRMYESEDEFQFVDSDGVGDDDGDQVFTVKASGTWDVAGDYLVRDSQTGEDVVVLDNDLSLLRDTWQLRDADDRSMLAEITSRGALVTLARGLLPFGQWIPHEFEITDAEGERVGSIESDFAIFDEYQITLSDTSSVPAAPIVVAAIVIDAIQGN